MRNLIKKILKEELHNDYDMVRKGIDILISLLKKTYPFIVGWKSDKEDINSSEWWIDIHLVVSASKAKEYYNMEYKNFYINYPDELEEIFNSDKDYAYPVSLFDYESYHFDAYQNNREIKTLADDMYELIPEEYKFQEERTSSILNHTYIINKDIRIDSYMFVK